MNKTINITLNAQLFALEEDAYFVLKAYLDAVKQHLSAGKDSAEILNDIECSIAEKFSDLTKKGREVIDLKSVEKIISVMGKPEVIAGDKKEDSSESRADEKASERSPATKTKKLYRNTDDVIIAGVASGIAVYFNIDPVIVRLLFFITIFFNGIGILVYFILWLIMPPAVTSSQRLEMQGAAVTLKKLEEIAKEKAENVRKKASEHGGVKRLIMLPFRFVGEIFRAIGIAIKKFGPILLCFFGFIIMLGASLAIAFIVFAGTVLIFAPNSNIIKSGIPINEIINGLPYGVFIFSSSMAALIPLIVIMLIGISLFKKRLMLSGLSAGILFLLWLAVISLSGALAVSYYPKTEDLLRAQREGKKTLRNIDVKEFNRIDIDGPHNIKIIKGEKHSLLAKGYEFDLNNIEVNSNGGVLKIDDKSRNGICFFCDTKELSFEITLPSLNDLRLIRTANVDIEGFEEEQFSADLYSVDMADFSINADNLSLSLSGYSNAVISGEYAQLLIDARGFSSIKSGFIKSEFIDITLSNFSEANLIGSAQEMRAELEDRSVLSAYGMSLEKASVYAEDSSRAEINARARLDMKAAKNAKILYRGEPAINIIEDAESEIESSNNVKTNSPY